MNNILPDLNQIGSLLLEILCLIVVFILVEVRNLLTKWFLTHTTSQQRETIHRVAGEAVSFARLEYAALDGPAKMAAAVAYLSSWLKNQKGWNVTPDEVKAIIQKAYDDYKALTTQPAPADQPVQIVEKEESACAVAG